MELFTLDKPSDKPLRISRKISGPLAQAVPDIVAEVMGKLRITGASNARTTPLGHIQLQDETVKEYGAGFNMAFNAKYQEALKQFRKVFQAAPDFVDAAYMNALIMSVSRYNAMAVRSEARAALDRYIEAGSSQWAAETYKLIGDALMADGEHVLARSSYGEIVSKYDGRVPSELMARVFYNLGLSCRLAGSDKTAEYFTKSLEFSEKSDFYFVAAFSALALAQHHFGDADPAGWIRSAERYVELYGDKSLRPELSLIKGNILAKNGRFPEAKKEYQAGLASASGEPAMTAKLNYAIGICRPKDKSDSEAVSHLVAALPLARRAGDCNLQSRIYSALGDAYSGTGESESAIKNYRASLSNLRSCPSGETEARVYLGLGNTYLKNGDVAAAQDSFLTGTRTARPLQNSDVLFRLQFNLGVLAARKGDNLKAQEWLESAAKNGQLSRDKALLKRVYQGLAETSDSLGDEAKSRKYAEELALLNERGETDDTPDALDVLYEEKQPADGETGDVVAVKLISAPGSGGSRTESASAGAVEEAVMELAGMGNVLVVGAGTEGESEAALKKSGAVSGTSFMDTGGERPADYRVNVRAAEEKNGKDIRISGDCVDARTGFKVFGVSASGARNAVDRIEKEFAAKLVARFGALVSGRVSEFKTSGGKYTAPDWYYRGRFFEKKGDLAEAEKSYKEAIKISPDTQKYIRVLGNLYQSRKMFAEALSEYSELEKAALRAGGKPADLAKVYNDYGTLYLEKGELEKAEPYFLELQGIIAENSLGEMEAATDMANIAAFHLARGEYEKGIDILKKSLARAENVGGGRNAVLLAKNIAIAYRDKGDADNADKFYSKAIELARGEKDGGVLISDCFKERGLLKQAAGKYGQAVPYFLKGLDLIADSEDKARLAGLYHLLGGSYLSMGKVSAAEDYLGRALRLRESAKDEGEVAQICLRLGMAKMNLGEEKKGIELLEEAARIARRHTTYSDRHIILLGLKEAYVATGKKEQALAVMREALSTAEKFSPAEAAADRKMLERMEMEEE